MTVQQYKADVQLTAKFYGYPVCCAAMFARSCLRAPAYGRVHRPEQWKAKKKCGFIPCRRHAAWIAKGKVDPLSLITDRKASWSVLPETVAYYNCRTETWDEVTAAQIAEYEAWIASQRQTSL